MTRHKHKVQQEPAKVRVIVDTRDASKDKWLTREEVQKLDLAGKLEQINCYSGRWDWAFKSRGK